MNDKNLYRCGLWGLISLGVAFACGLACDLMTGNRILTATASWCAFALSLLPWWFFSCSSAKWGKAMRGYILAAIVVHILSYFIRGNLENNFAIALGWTAIEQAVFAVLTLVVLFKNSGKLRKALVFFTIAAWINATLYALTVLVGIVATPQSPLFATSTTCLFGLGNILRVVYVVGFLYMMHDASALGESTKAAPVVGLPRRWRIFWALAPWILLLPPHFNRGAIVLLCAPAGLFGLFCDPINAHSKMALLLAAGFLTYILLSIAIACVKKRRAVVALIFTFVVLLLMNAGGCVRMASCF